MNEKDIIEIEKDFSRLIRGQNFQLNIITAHGKTVGISIDTRTEKEKEEY